MHRARAWEPTRSRDTDRSSDRIRTPRTAREQRKQRATRCARAASPCLAWAARELAVTWYRSQLKIQRSRNKNGLKSPKKVEKLAEDPLPLSQSRHILWTDRHQGFCIVPSLNVSVNAYNRR